jgi:prepilin-type N-terminal cleavage/methylation domain-containing protein
LTTFGLEQRGVTLIEQLMSLAIGSVMIVLLYAYFRSEIYHSLALETKTAALEDSRGALDIMTRDLRNAGSWGTGSAPPETGVADDPQSDADAVCNRVYQAGPGVIHVQMDLNGNGNCADVDPRESIRYELTGPTSTCPGPYIIRRNGDCLVANVVPAANGRIFTFYDRQGVELGSAPIREAIRRVKVEFAVQSRNPDPKVSGHVGSALISSVEFRN